MGFTRAACDTRPDVSFDHRWSARDTKRWACNRYNKSSLCKSSFEGERSWKFSSKIFEKGAFVDGGFFFFLLIFHHSRGKKNPIFK